MRLLPVSVYVGIMRSTENNDNPIHIVCGEPFSGTSFDSYRWFRSTIKIRVQDAVEEISNDGLIEIDSE